MDFKVENFVVDGKMLVVKSKVTPLSSTKDYLVEFIIFDGLQIWYFKDNLETVKPKGVEISNHNDLILEAISKQDIEAKKFVYKWKQDKEEATFSIGFTIVDKKGEFRSAIFRLQKKQGSGIEAIYFVSELVSMLKNTQQQMETIREKAEISELCQRKLDQVINEKKDMEQQLYSGFIELVNRKKRKLISLNEDYKTLRTKYDQLQSDLQRRVASPILLASPKCNAKLTSPVIENTPKRKRLTHIIETDDILLDDDEDSIIKLQEDL